MRPLRHDELGAVLALWNRSAPFDPLTPSLLEEKLEDPELALVDDDLTAFAMGARRASGLGYVKMLAVAPEARNRGLGSELLKELERRLGTDEIRVAESHPNYLQPGIDVRYTVGTLFFEKHGYRRIGETYNLECDLRQNFESDAPAGIEVRRTCPDDPLMPFLEAHFPSWRPEVAVSLQRSAVHIALRHNQILGFAAYDGNNLGTGWFGPMGTALASRGLGLGRVLLRRCLADLQAQGLKRCTIPWVGPYGFYSRHCGSRIDRVFWRYARRKGETGVRD